MVADFEVSGRATALQIVKSSFDGHPRRRNIQYTSFDFTMWFQFQNKNLITDRYCSFSILIGPPSYAYMYVDKCVAKLLLFDCKWAANVNYDRFRHKSHG